MGKLGSPTGLQKAQAVASYVIESLLTLDGVTEALVAGSIRRQRPVVSDVDIVVITDGITDMTEFRGKLEDGRMAFTPRGGVGLIQQTRVELYLAPQHCEGATLQFLTGPGSLNVWLRSMAKNRGWKLSQYGLVDSEGVRLETRTGDPFADEMSIFEALDIDFMPPEDRDHWREIKHVRR